MKLRVERLWKKPAYTVGRLFVDGKFFCNTLEATVRDLSNEKKVYGKSAIPYGEYKLVSQVWQKPATIAKRPCL